MAIRHSILRGGTIVTFINRPVELEDVFETLGALSPFAHFDAEWRQVVVLGENTLSSLSCLDFLTVSDWLREVCKGFSECFLTLCATTDAEFSAARDFAELVVGERVSVAVFRDLRQAAAWRPVTAMQLPANRQSWYGEGNRYTREP